MDTMNTYTYHTTNYVIRNSADMFLEDNSVSTNHTSWTYLHNRALIFDEKATAEKAASKINEVYRNENRIDPQGNPMTVRVCTMKATVIIEG